MTDRMIANTSEPMRHPWPEDCFVQGGGSGVVFAEGQPYRTAFVEAFPGTFLRGEGKTIADAENAAWARYQVLAGCDHDQGFDRRQYVNGCGFCRGCGTWFGSDVTGFEPLPEYYEPTANPTLLDRLFSGDADALAKVITTMARKDDLPEAPGA